MNIFKNNANLVAVAISQVFVHDTPGAYNNPTIMQYAADLGFHSYVNDDIAWCALFMNWILFKCGLKGTGSLSARSFLGIGVELHTPPEVGDIAVFWRGSPDSPYGHVTLYLNSILRDGVMFYRVLGGNQSDQVKISEMPAAQLIQFRRV